ncbi:excinuclease ABC subunit A [Tropicimonas sediminicola]|uniref:Excinuclease ABC subunit A n=1 Tax=Tropicimonas sediminicola TaxID=1031541 RepID=A0A239H253_9RHOB|nr:excinuclease ABC subunit A [Tropicimonas sediminicola]SNS75556.1 hypothetical protein SAMN05421757_103218 [Tropicimonas sediminicola]
MKTLATVLLTAAFAAGIGAGAASAGNGNAGCPPGLAKKNPPCVPPGQVGKSVRSDAPDRDDRYVRRYQRGEVLDGDYRVIHDPARYRLDRNGDYAVLGDYVYRIDPDTRKVLNLIGAIADLAQ